MRRAGFTLLELMVTISIVAIMASLSVASGQAFLSITRANSAAAAASQSLRDAKVRAMTSHCSQLVVFNPTGSLASAPFGFDQTSGGIQGIAKFNCFSTSISDGGVGTWNFSGGTSTAPLDRPLAIQDINEFRTQVTVAGQAVGPSTGVAIAFDEFGAVRGTFTVSNTAVGGTFTPVPSGGVEVEFSRPDSPSARRTVLVSSTGAVSMGKADGGS